MCMPLDFFSNIQILEIYIRTGIIMNTLLASDNLRLSLSKVLMTFIMFCTHVFAYGSDDMYYRHNNINCIQCQPGTHWVADCATDGGSAVCKPCPEGFYISKYNLAWFCQKCSASCRNTNHGEQEEQREYVARNCTSTSDLKCQCRDGFWREQEMNGACRTVTSCGLGSGVKTIASENSDTVCEVCIHGETFSNSTSTKEKCLPCSICSNHQILKQPCTRTDDTVCIARSTDREKLSIGLGVGIALFLILCAACGCGLRAIWRSRSKNANTELRHVNGEHHELTRRNTNRHDETNGHARHEMLNETVGQSNEESVYEPVYEQDQQEVEDGAKGSQINEHAQCIAAETNELGQYDADDALKSELFMQEVYCALSAEMDSNYKTFFRRNGISERMISIIDLEESRVRDRCYKLFIDWAKKQEHIVSLPTYEVPLELIRRLADMFQQDEDLNSSKTCIAILGRFEIKWC
ncbi:tumor necrosis factor receptor superfamily member 16-like isoform X1 [Dreissena polymorpha]|uniref:tumor necrosis factor receptor superfamily member 16-like isoform X1 n=2 Tax=Dreissena polymorpha TaxID=45954 RepID=UPI00226494BA|nr:tumor necrosis factor receptor superfamily member 16-like isoform X1 [Dreissena polymorpha]